MSSKEETAEVVAVAETLMLSIVSAGDSPHDLRTRSTIQVECKREWGATTDPSVAGAPHSSSLDPATDFNPTNQVADAVSNIPARPLRTFQADQPRFQSDTGECAEISGEVARELPVQV